MGFLWFFFRGFSTWIVNRWAGKGRGREKICELGLNGLERALGWPGMVGELFATLGGTQLCSSFGFYFPLYFPLSFLSMVFLLIISLESNEKLYFKVLPVFKTVTAVSSIIREMWWADFLGC